MLMSTAMMVPAALPAVRRVALGALWHRRQRVAGLFLASYLGVWAAFGAVALSSAAVVQHVVQADTETLTSGVLIAAAAWELTRWKRRSLRGCHVIPPLPPRGWKADAACMRAGLRYGQQCVVGCWALMLTMAITGHASPALTPFLAVLIASQRLLVRGTQIGPLASLALVSTAVFLVTA
jgi:predicted metal-binding membrane protein